jgi:hypothetical protein
VANFSTRITSDLRDALERQAKLNGHSLSQEVQQRLVASIRRDRYRDRQRHICALAEAITLAAERIEGAIGKRWHDDAFTAKALQRGIVFLVEHFSPLNTSAAASWNVDEAVNIGLTEAGHVIAWIESWNFRSLDECMRVAQAVPGGADVPNEWYAHEQLFRELGSGWERAQAKDRRQ